jgi:hypothetical protein
MPPIIDKYVSFAHLKRRAAEKKRKETGDWSKDSIAASWGYMEHKTPNIRPKLHRVRKELASRYYQSMMGHAVIAPYLKHKLRYRTRTPDGGARKTFGKHRITSLRIAFIGRRI